MKTLTIDIQDSFLKEFLNFVQKSQNKILVRNSSDYEDIYFDDRRNYTTSKNKRRYKRWQRKALFNR